MRNRIVGFVIIGIAALIGGIIYLFNRALSNIVNASCSHGPTCPMWGNIDFHTNISLGIMTFVVLIGLYLVFFGEEKLIVTKIKKVKEQIKPKQITIENYKKVLDSLDDEEKEIVKKLIAKKGSSFQSDFVTGNLTKVKVTRLLDKLEGKGVIERKRRGMTNIVILKSDK
jgi:hypothetical protein